MKYKIIKTRFGRGIKVENNKGKCMEYVTERNYTERNKFYKLLNEIQKDNKRQSNR